MEHFGGKEIDNIWHETFQIRTFMCDKNLEATLPSIGNVFQEAAGNHAIFNKLGYYDMLQQNMFWVLNRLKIQVLRFPKWQEFVTVKTWASDMQPFSQRHYLMLNTEGVELAYGFALWIPIDAASHRPKRLTVSNMPLIKKETPCGTASKLTEIENLEHSSNKMVEYSDIDFLSHVNNVKYIEWLLDGSARKYGESHFKELEINYINQCTLNDGAEIWTRKDHDTIHFELKRMSDGKEICRAKLF